MDSGTTTIVSAVVELPIDKILNIYRNRLVSCDHISHSRCIPNRLRLCTVSSIAALCNELNDPQLSEYDVHSILFHFRSVCGQIFKLYLYTLAPATFRWTNCCSFPRPKVVRTRIDTAALSINTISRNHCDPVIGISNPLYLSVYPADHSRPDIHSLSFALLTPNIVNCVVSIVILDFLL